MANPAELLSALPQARRYARALLGAQAAGDAVVGQALTMLPEDLPPRLALLAAVTALTPSSGSSPDLPPLARHLLLLTAVEELSPAEAARVTGLDEAEALRRVQVARDAIKATVVTRVLIIEDEPIIAMDLRMLLEDCGHTVIGIAANEAQALRLATEEDAGLIIADINLGRGGNGIEAVRNILARMEVPVIFVTAYPEDLLTAEGVEPAFVMRKPFDRFMLAVFTYQAISAGYIPLP